MRIKSNIHKSIDGSDVFGTLVSIAKEEIYIKLENQDKISVYPKSYLGNEFKIIRIKNNGGNK